MTLSEFLEKYGKVEVTFDSYYKYRFSFVGVASEGTEVGVSVGGDHGSIYRFDVSSSPTTIEALHYDIGLSSSHVGGDYFFWD